MSQENIKLPIIALDHTLWQGNWMNRQHILSRLGERGWPVIYSNGARYYNNIDFFHPFASVEKKNHVDVYRSGSFFPRNYKIKLLDRLAIRAHCNALKKKAGIKKGDDFIALCFHPDFYPYVEELNAPYVMFHIYDVFQNRKNPERNDFNIQRITEKADLITASSEIIWDEMVQDKTLTPNIIHNGVDFSSFEKEGSFKGDVYKDIAKISSPKVGYLGAINKKLDFCLLDRLAEQFPDVVFTMIGTRLEASIKEDEKLWAGYQRFCKQPNVVFTGAIAKEEIASCLSLMDVTIAPYITDRSTWAFAGFPLKINEYLASGKPVVSAATDTIVQHFSDIVTICRSFEDWEQDLKRILSGKGDGTPELRMNFARLNDWDSKIDKLEDLMSGVIGY
ncbi:MAG: glycosyltransferase [Emcibacter sp.]|nr:glycosyltransferase [Emcibacter sp.]